MLDVEEMIRTSLYQIRAKRREVFIHAAGQGMRVHREGERVLLLPNGHAVKVTTDDSGITTQVEEDEALHAVVRPNPLVIRRNR